MSDTIGRTRIAVAMSGGVDSSVAAALLVEQGHEVIGLTMQIWPREVREEADPGERGCCGLEAVDDARRVAHLLGIRHYVLDLREAFQRRVIDPFCEEYARGRTPNPCLLCNAHVKYEELLQRAERLGATHLATGHYARVARDGRSRRWTLRHSADPRKDQTYALYGLRQEQLAKARFPLGDMTKTETRALAAKLGLPTSEKPESQQICFIQRENYREYLERVRPGVDRAGPIVDTCGRQVGRHRGLRHYTIGQRHGLGVAASAPRYVVAIDAPHNLLTIGGEEDLAATGLLMERVNWVAFSELPAAGACVQVKIRYGSAAEPCQARRAGEAVQLRFTRPVRAVTPGQAAVCYDVDSVVFGGVIERAL